MIDNRLNYPHILLLQWLIFIFAVTFFIWLAWQQGIIQDVLRTDPTKLSLIIMLIFIACTVHCAIRSVFLSQQLNELGKIVNAPNKLHFADNQLYFNKQLLPSSLIADYLVGVFRYRQSLPKQAASQQLSKLDAVLNEHANGSHESGWFFSQLLIKLGLLGTVIGFILMLTAISSSALSDISQVHALFSDMAQGMRVALNTTLTGLLGAMLLGFQYLMLDRGADRLLSNVIHFAETYPSTVR